MGSSAASDLYERQVIGRLGGDEFVAMLSDSDSDSAGEVLSRFAAAVEENNKTANKPTTLNTVSV